MPYLIAILLVAVIAIFVGVSSVRSQTPTTRNTSTVGQSQTANTTRSKVERRLEALAQSEAPTKLSMGAMCYEPAMMPMTVDYVCPKCGEKTLYSRAPEDESTREYKNTPFIATAIPDCRRLAKSVQDLKIKGLTVTLDESKFCAKCSPDLKEPPKLVLVIHYDGEEEAHRVEDITANDLRLVLEFMSGESTHKDAQDRETPLKNHVKRLRELLGSKIEQRVEDDGGDDE